MPPSKKYTKKEILDIAYDIVEHDGFESLNARKIARKLNASVQPIFFNFPSMEDLKKEVYCQIYQTYQEYMNIETDQLPYKQSGLSYIKFAKEKPQFFKILFMHPTTNSPENFIVSDSIGDDIIKKGQQLTKLSYEEQKKFHVKVWIFTHGIACLVATNTVKFSEKEIEELLTSTVISMLKGYRGENV